MVYKTPGVYIQDITSPPTMTGVVEAAVPAFIGYTETAREQGESLHRKPTRIASLAEYEQLFGGPARVRSVTVTLDAGNAPRGVSVAHAYLLYHALRLYFDNGGGDCYIVSVGGYSADGVKSKHDLETGLNAAADCAAVTLLLMPDAALLGDAELADLQNKALSQCATLRNRFALFDLAEWRGHNTGVAAFRTHIGDRNLAYGAAYTPYLKTTLTLGFDYRDIDLQQGGKAVTLAAVSAAAGLDTAPVNAIDKALLHGEPPIVIDRLNQDLKQRNGIYADICNAIQQAGMMLPPSGAVAGAYVKVDRERGVWKAPANVSLNTVKGVAVSIDDAQQQRLNVDPVSGKSINAIREFAVSATGWKARSQNWPTGSCSNPTTPTPGAGSNSRSRTPCSSCGARAHCTAPNRNRPTSSRSVWARA